MKAWLVASRLLAASAILLSISPISAAAQVETATASSDIGAHTAPNRPLTAAEATAQREIEGARRRLLRDPDDAGHQHDVLVADRVLGDLFFSGGDLVRARQAYALLLEDARRYAANYPRTLACQVEISVAEEKIGDVMMAQGDLAAARTAYEDDLSIARRLFAASDTMPSLDPRRTKRFNELYVSISLQKVGDVLAAQGDLAGARSNYSEALSIARRLALASPNDREIQRDLAVYLWHLAEFGGASVGWADVVTQLETMAAKHMITQDNQNWLPEAKRRAAALGART